MSNALLNLLLRWIGSLESEVCRGNPEQNFSLFHGDYPLFHGESPCWAFCQKEFPHSAFGGAVYPHPCIMPQPLPEALGLSCSE